MGIILLNRVTKGRNVTRPGGFLWQLRKSKSPPSRKIREKGGAPVIMGWIFQKKWRERRADECVRLYAIHARNRGRVRQVGPPLPLMQISLPGKVRTSNPDWRRRALVLRFSSMDNRRFPPNDRTLQASVSRSA
jgi:hypothetical protein